MQDTGGIDDFPSNCPARSLVLADRVDLMRTFVKQHRTDVGARHWIAKFPGSMIGIDDTHSKPLRYWTRLPEINAATTT